MKRKDGVGYSGIDWPRGGYWLGAGDEEGDLPNQPVRAGNLEPRARAGRVAGEPRSIWVGSCTTADIVAPVTWLAEREHAVMKQATLRGELEWVLLGFVATLRGITTGSTSEPEVTGVVFVGCRRDGVCVVE